MAIIATTWVARAAASNTWATVATSSATTERASSMAGSTTGLAQLPTRSTAMTMPLEDSGIRIPRPTLGPARSAATITAAKAGAFRHAVARASAGAVVASTAEAVGVGTGAGAGGELKHRP